MKQSEINNLSVEELNSKLIEFKNKLFELKMNHSVTPLENPLQIRYLRRDVARIATAISDRKNKVI
jgi:large subunit ribosomal protein L29|tara:strand:- start:8 stop:205 length:198 start_codon:yes stop_codon:yes gene_type:complete